MHSAMGVQKSSVYVEEVGIAVIPTKTILDVCGALGGHLTADHLFGGLKGRTLAARRTLETIADLFGVEFQFGDGAPQGVAVHAELLRRFALVAPVMRQHFHDETPLELAHGLVVVNTAGMHLRHKTVQLTFHRNLFLLLNP
jgi:hypothetical protein